MESLVGGTWEVLLSRSCKIRSSSRFFYDDLVSFPSESWHEDLDQGLLYLLMTLCEDLVEILRSAVTGFLLYMILFWSL